MEHQERKSLNWLDKPLLENNFFTIETFIFILIIVLAIVSRFYNLGARTISHDETSHVYYAWRLYKGMGYSHTPITHGPLQFHLVALSYFFFGDNDFTARIPAAIFSILTIAFVWNYKRYLGKIGTLITALLFLISPYMLYYGRYVRNEAFIGVFGLITLWAILNYLESGKVKYTYWLTAVTMLHFTTKETAFIYTAQALIFLGLVFVASILKANWKNPRYRKPFISLLIISLIVIVAFMGIKFFSNSPSTTVPTAEIAQESSEVTTAVTNPLLTILPLSLIVLTLLVALYFAIRGFSWDLLKKERSFSLIILLMTLVLPQLAPFPVKFMGWDPTDYSYQGMLRTGAFVIPLVLISIGIGLLWNRKLWLINAGIFYIPFVLLYTSFFTNGNGFFTGLVGSLGYWLEQQGVNRGSQPWYYYIGLQIPFYEYLPALGSIIALWLVSIKRRNIPTTNSHKIHKNINSDNLFIPFLGFWIITSIIAYTIAGEKMPWLTFHIVWPMILLAGWTIGKLIEHVDWSYFRENQGLITLGLLFVFLLSLSKVLAVFEGSNPPFQGDDLSQLSSTSLFLVSSIIVISSGIWLAILINKWDLAEFGRVFAITMFGFLAILTARTSIMASYINYNNPTEYLVYAHMARGPKEAFEQIKELSERTTDSLSMLVAYDDETTYPFWWYLRNFPNQKYYGENPTRDLRDAPVILVGNKNFDKLTPVVGQAYFQFDYIRIWWPNQDYFNLTWERIKNALFDREMRNAIFQIWFNHDYTKYFELTNKDISLQNWSPSDRMRLYVRKDIASKVWNLGLSPVSKEEIKADPYEGKGLKLIPDIVIGGEGTDAGKFESPRNIAIAPDGSLYVADTGNHRIQHLSAQGEFINMWGSFADISTGNAQPGTFYEPWGIAVDNNNNVYVADTWNHRIQKFDEAGNFIEQWGFFGQGEEPTAFWGPRDIKVDSQNRIFVTDTGNKRIVIFTSDGDYINQFGSAGLMSGQFDEPVGIAIDNEGRIFVADTWNQRIQRFVTDNTFTSFTADKEWEISGWYGQSLDNKPYLAISKNNQLYISDPEGYRILEFDTDGNFIKYWGDYGSGPDGLNLPTGLAVDKQGGVWVVDTGNHRVLHFSLEPESKD